MLLAHVIGFYYCKVPGVVLTLQDATSMCSYGHGRSGHIATVVVLQRVSDVRTGM